MAKKNYVFTQFQTDKKFGDHQDSYRLSKQLQHIKTTEECQDSYRLSRRLKTVSDCQDSLRHLQTIAKMVACQQQVILLPGPLSAKSKFPLLKPHDQNKKDYIRLSRFTIYLFPDIEYAYKLYCDDIMGQRRDLGFSLLKSLELIMHHQTFEPHKDDVERHSIYHNMMSSNSIQVITYRFRTRISSRNTGIYIHDQMYTYNHYSACFTQF